MKIINYSNARQTLRKVIDDCVNDNELVCIESKTNKVIVMSEAEYIKSKKELYELKASLFNNKGLSRIELPDSLSYLMEGE